MTPANTHKPTTQRIALLDVARGIALVAMAIYHFAWDLEFFGWLLPSTTLTGGWLYFARSIATSFLFLVGVSLVLAHQHNIRWRSFGKRFAQIAGAALLISIATWFAVPNGFIFFGILHAIALFSLFGLLFVRAHWGVMALAGLLVLVINWTVAHPIFAEPALWWVGLAPVAPPANDYVPTFPWLAPVLFGMATSKWLRNRNLWSKIAAQEVPQTLERPLSFFGRHSLVFYLAHQPILIGIVWTFTTFIAAPNHAAQFESQCRTSCAQTRDGPFCQSYCQCIVDDMKQEQLLTPFMKRQLSEGQNSRLLEMRDQCVGRFE